MSTLNEEEIKKKIAAAVAEERERIALACVNMRLRSKSSDDYGKGWNDALEALVSYLRA